MQNEWQNIGTIFKSLLFSRFFHLFYTQTVCTMQRLMLITLGAHTILNHINVLGATLSWFYLKLYTHVQKNNRANKRKHTRLRNWQVAVSMTL